MAIIKAAPGGGNWSSGSTWVGGAQPSSADDAVLDATSGNVTIDTNGLGCRSLDCNGYTGTLTHASGVTLYIGHSTPGAGNIAMRMVPGMTYTLGNTATSAITFNSTNATTQSIVTGGKIFGNVSFSGGGSSYILANSLILNSSATLSFSAGTLNTNNQYIYVGFMLVTGAIAKTLTLGSSAITISGNSTTTALNATGATFTVSPNTAVITFTGQGAGFNTGADWNGLSIVFANTVNFARVFNGPTLANVTYNGMADKTSDFMFSAGTTTITGTLTITGDSEVNRVLVHSELVGTSRPVSAAVVALTNADFQDISASGAAAPWTGTSLGDAQGNTGITFTPSETQTRTAGAGGNWSDPSRWTSRVPLPQDDVVVGSDVTGGLYFDMPRLGRNIDYTGFTGSTSGSIAHEVYGSLTLSSEMTLYGPWQTILAGRGSHTITSNGTSFGQSIRTVAPGGTYTLTDAFATTGFLSVGVSVANAAVPGGTFDSAGFPVRLGAILDLRHAESFFNLGTSTLTLLQASGTMINFSSGFVPSNLDADEATLVVETASASARAMNASGMSYGALVYDTPGSTGELTVRGSNTFGTLTVGPGRTLTLTSGATTTVTNLNIVGTEGNLTTINATVPGSVSTLTAASGMSASMDYVSLQDINGGGVIYAGAHSVKGTNVLGGIHFQKLAAPGGGNWTSPSTWVDGVVPTAADAVVLDATSGNVTINANPVVARSLDCTGYTGTLTHASGTQLNLGDSIAPPNNVAIKMVPGMNYAVPGGGVIAFVSTATTQQTVATGGKWVGTWSFEGAGSSYLLMGPDGLTQAATTHVLMLSKGTFDTGNNPMSLGMMTISGSTAKTLVLGSSTITFKGVSGGYALNTAGVGAALTVPPNTAQFIFTSVVTGINGGWWNGASVTFTSAVTTATLGGSLRVQDVTYVGGANRNSRLQFSGGSNNVVAGLLSVVSDSDVNRILFATGTLGAPATVDAGSVALSNVDFQDIVAGGASAPWTGTSMGDALNNTNITFDAPVTQTRTGAGGAWSNAAQWTSRVPLPQDDVLVGAGASGAITGDMPRIGRDIDFTGFAGTWNPTTASTPTWTAYGSLTFSPTMSIGGTVNAIFGGRGSHTITSNGRTFPVSTFIRSPGGTYTLADPITVGAAPTGGSQLVLDNGTLITNGHDVTAPSMVSAANTTLDLGSPDVFDSFNHRVVTSGWGAADTGQTYLVGSTGPEYSISGGQGITDFGGASTRLIRMPVPNTDSDLMIDVALASTPVGANVDVLVSARRSASASTDYRISLTFSSNGLVVGNLSRFLAGVPTSLGTVLTSTSYTPGTFYRVRLRCVSGSIQAKVWLASAPEPDAWALSVSDNAVASGDQFLLGAVPQPANTSPDSRALFENLSIRMLRPTLVDTFSRTVAAGSWGISDSGYGYVLTGTASNFSVSGGQARITAPADQVRLAITTPVFPHTDVDAIFDVGVAQIQIGNSARPDVLVRSTSNAFSGYRVNFEFRPNGTVSFNLIRNLSGAATYLATTFGTFTYSAGEMFRARIQCIGTMIRSKVWRALDPEPSAWGTSVTDADVPAGDHIGLRSYSNAGTTTPDTSVLFDNVSVIDLSDRSSSTMYLGTTNGAQLFGVSSGTNLLASQAGLVVVNPSANGRTIFPGGKALGEVDYTVAGSSGTLGFTGGGTVGTLNFSDASTARTLELEPGTTLNVSEFNVTGGPDRAVTLKSRTPGQQAALFKADGIANDSDYLTITDVNAGGGATWYAGDHSVNGGNSNGWIFLDDPATTNFFAMFAGKRNW